MKKIQIIFSLIMICLTLTSCAPLSMSNLTGQGALANSDIVFPEDDKDNETIKNPDTDNEKDTNIQTEVPKTPNTEQNIPSTPEKEENPVKPAGNNKTGPISFKYYLLKGSGDITLKNTTVINTVEEYNQIMNGLTGYSNLNKLDGTILNDYFLIAIPVTSSNNSWDYFVDSVKNDTKLNITIMCEKKKDTTSDNTIFIVFAAVRRSEIPNTPTTDQINIKHNSYTVK